MSKKRILVIDDFQPLLEEVRDFLIMEDYEVFTAKNGAEGVQKALTVKPDMILCDILMPELNGYEVYQTISKISDLATVPFIFITARATPEDYRKGLALGVDDYITKPFTLVEILNSIQKRFEKVEKYQSVKQDLVQFFFSNPILGVFIFSENDFIFINDRIKKLFNYTLEELNKIDLKSIFVGNYQENINNINLMKSGTQKITKVQCGIISKDKKTINVEVHISNVLFNGKDSFIGCMIEKDITENQNDLSNGIHKFIDFLDYNTKKEISTELNLVYNQIQVNEKTKNNSKQKNIKISDREKEILLFISKGFTDKEIAENLFLSFRTVSNHRANLMDKTDTKNSAELIAFSIKNKLIEI